MYAPFESIGNSNIFKDKILKESSLYQREEKIDDMYYEDNSLMYNPYKKILNKQKNEITKLINEKKAIEGKLTNRIEKKQTVKDYCSLNKEHLSTCNRCRYKMKENFDMDSNKDIINVALYGLTGVFLLFMFDILGGKK